MVFCVRPFRVVSSPIRMIWLVRGQGGNVTMTLEHAHLQKSRTAIGLLLGA